MWSIKTPTPYFLPIKTNCRNNENMLILILTIKTAANTIYTRPAGNKSHCNSLLLYPPLRGLLLLLLMMMNIIITIIIIKLGAPLWGRWD